ncbi:hypothetical protein JRC04_24155 [Mycolicibacterium sp. S2-37]|uniref:hypothetical protein n=1 Tax=Mycolicibacterium sp. S2-37 TaxID=2810297 RepID=UPI001A93B73F|nr:hypothetical protein [Mycolicibacterium sp. S2-37]MBO0680571.1 hypothetical protein [Mycolicibacterium sp. S2-37]
MAVTARKFCSAAITLTAASAIAFTPLVLPPQHRPPPVTAVSMPEVRLAVTSTEVGALAGMPVDALIGVVDNIVRLLDGTFTGLIGATDDPTGVRALTILKTFSVDAFAKLAENLTLGNAVITPTATEVAALVSTAMTGSLRTAVGAAARVVADPLSPAGYAGLLAAGSQLVDNGLAIVHALGDAGVELLRIAVSEVTFQFTNAVTRLGELVTVLGAPPGSPRAAATDDVAPTGAGPTAAPSPESEESQSMSAGFMVSRRSATGDDVAGVTRELADDEGDDGHDDEVTQRVTRPAGIDTGVASDADVTTSAQTREADSGAAAGVER